MLVACKVALRLEQATFQPSPARHKGSLRDQLGAAQVELEEQRLEAAEELAFSSVMAGEVQTLQAQLETERHRFPVELAVELAVGSQRQLHLTVVQVEAQSHTKSEAVGEELHQRLEMVPTEEQEGQKQGLEAAS